MKFELRDKYLSQPRYNRYLMATGNNKSRAKQLYTANIRLAQAFHPMLSQFEIDCTYALDIRNKIYDLVQWINASLVYFFEQIDNIENKIKKIEKL